MARSEHAGPLGDPGKRGLPAPAMVCGAMDYTIRRARTQDVRAIAGLVNTNVESGRLLGKATMTLYEDRLRLAAVDTQTRPGRATATLRALLGQPVSRIARRSTATRAPAPTATSATL